MARNGKDHFGIATNAFDKTLKSDEAKQRLSGSEIDCLPLAEQIKVKEERAAQEKEAVRLRKEKEQKALEEPKFTGVINREEYMRNKAIITAKANKTYEKPPKPGKEPKKERVIEIVQALYGLQEEKFIDITNKIKIGQKVNNELAGEDPCPRKKKNVIVRVKIDGIETETTFIEGKKIVF